MTILTVADLRPFTLGSNVISKLVLPDAETEEAGALVTVKSAALAPPIVIVLTERLVVPKFCIVNVLTCDPPVVATLPKSVSSEASGVVSPSTIFVAFPCIFI